MDKPASSISATDGASNGLSHCDDERSAPTPQPDDDKSLLRLSSLIGHDEFSIPPIELIVPPPTWLVKDDINLETLSEFETTAETLLLHVRDDAKLETSSDCDSTAEESLPDLPDVASRPVGSFRVSIADFGETNDSDLDAEYTDDYVDSALDYAASGAAKFSCEYEYDDAIDEDVTLAMGNSISRALESSTDVPTAVLSPACTPVNDRQFPGQAPRFFPRDKLESDDSRISVSSQTVFTRGRDSTCATPLTADILALQDMDLRTTHIPKSTSEEHICQKTPSPVKRTSVPSPGTPSHALGCPSHRANLAWSLSTPVKSSIAAASAATTKSVTETSRRRRVVAPPSALRSAPPITLLRTMSSASPVFREHVARLKSAVPEERRGALKELLVLLDEAWAMPVVGKELAYKLCDVLRQDGGLDSLVVLFNNDDNDDEVRRTAAKVFIIFLLLFYLCVCLIFYFYFY